jgi:hypothetical protein
VHVVASCMCALHRAEGVSVYVRCEEGAGDAPPPAACVSVPTRASVLPAVLVQGLFFSTVPGLGYGLVQSEGGPCGGLAVVQAFTLKHIMALAPTGAWKSVRCLLGLSFPPPPPPLVCVCQPTRRAHPHPYPHLPRPHPPQPSPEVQRQAVIRAISDVVWGCVPAVSGAGRGAHALLALPGPRPLFGRSPRYPPDGFTETIVTIRCGEAACGQGRRAGRGGGLGAGAW